MADPRIKTMTIKTGIVKRLTKDKVSYEKEAEQEKIRLQKFKDEGKDDHVVRKQDEVVKESLMMIPDCQRRLQKAFEDLKSILDKEQDLKEQKEYGEARKVLEEAFSHLTEPTEIPHFC